MRCEAAESHEVAVKPSSEGFANGAAERFSHALQGMEGEENEQRITEEPAFKE